MSMRIKCQKCQIDYVLSAKRTEKKVQKYGSIEAVANSYLCRVCRVVSDVLSFGIEFEGSILNRQTGKPVSHCADRFTRLNKWLSQDDMTAGFEIMTPPDTSIDNIIDESQQQWKDWSATTGHLPLFKCNNVHKSIGHHIHIGMKNKFLTKSEKIKLAKNAIPILPICYFVNANDKGKLRDGKTVLSKRYYTSNYLGRLNSTYIGDSGNHYAEISDSSNGTVEFRAFDANLPQITLTTAFLLKNAIEMNRAGAEKTIDIDEYKKIRQAILENQALAVVQQKEALKNAVGSLVVKHNFMKEILYTALVLGENPSEFIKKWNVETVEKMIVTSPTEFFDNISVSKSDRKKLNHFKNHARTMNTVSDFCNTKIKVRNFKRFSSIVLQLKQADANWRRLLNEHFEFREAWTKKIGKIKAEKIVTFYRLNEVPNMPKEQAVDVVVATINLPDITSEFVVNTDDRFYIVMSNGNVSGVIQINVPNRIVKRVVLLSNDVKKDAEKFLWKNFKLKVGE